MRPRFVISHLFTIFCFFVNSTLIYFGANSVIWWVFYVFQIMVRVESTWTYTFVVLYQVISFRHCWVSFIPSSVLFFDLSFKWINALFNKMIIQYREL